MTSSRLKIDIWLDKFQVMLAFHQGSISWIGVPPTLNHLRRMPNFWEALSGVKDRHRVQNSLWNRPQVTEICQGIERKSEQWQSHTKLTLSVKLFLKDKAYLGIDRESSRPRGTWQGQLSWSQSQGQRHQHRSTSVCGSLPNWRQKSWQITITFAGW